MRLPTLRELLALLAPLALSACSLAYDLSSDQCGNNDDCSAFGEGYTCEEGICIPQCRVHEECASFGRNYGCVDGVCEPGVLAECEQASDCANFTSVPQACIEREPGNPGSRGCEELRTAECPLILPTGGGSQEIWREALSSRNPIIVGGFGEIDPDGHSTYTANYDLAFTELAESYGGIPGANGTLRPVVAVICNNGLLAEGMSKGMDHLVEDLHVPGLIAGMRSDQLQPLFGRVRESEINPNVLFMSPGEADRTVSGIQDDDLIWTLLPSAAEIAVAYEPLLTRTIDYLIAQDRVSETDTIRVSLISANDLPLLDELTDAVREILVFNGMTFEENLADGNAQVVDVISSYQDPNADLSSAIQTIKDFGPHIVVALNADELFADIIPGLEENWETEQPAGERRPFYLMSPYHSQSESLTFQFLSEYRTVDPINLRLAGVQYAAAPEEYQPIKLAYEERFMELFPDDARIGYENFYDAPWWLIYSLVAGAGTQSTFDGRDLVDGISRLEEGMPFAMGPDDVDDAFNYLGLSANNDVQLNGALGAPTFDNTGTRQSPGSVWCVTPGAVQVYDVLLVDESSGEPELVDGAFGFTGCNPNF